MDVGNQPGSRVQPVISLAGEGPNSALTPRVRLRCGVATKRVRRKNLEHHAASRVTSGGRAKKIAFAVLNYPGNGTGPIRTGLEGVQHAYHPGAIIRFRKFEDCASIVFAAILCSPIKEIRRAQVKSEVCLWISPVSGAKAVEAAKVVDYLIGSVRGDHEHDAF